MKRFAAVLSLFIFVAGGAAQADQVISDDLIVQGSECVGNDCNNGEGFGFDTFRLKENNLRIKFEDTSTASGFPSNDWQIRANDSANGGQNIFAIDDITGNGTPFAIEAGAGNDALYIENSGDIGVGTSQPALQLQITDGNTPALRLEQDGSAGFTPQTWDIAGNEANFFVRDVTNGSRLPFRIEPGTSSNILYLDNRERVGIGTNNPEVTLNVVRSSGEDAIVQVENNHSTAAQRIMFRLENNGAPQTEFENSNSGVTWRFGQNPSGSFVINDTEDLGVGEMRIDTDGDVFVNGSVVHSSSRTLKENFKRPDAKQILNKVVEVPISIWNYKDDKTKARRIGPMAEDFYTAFGFGDDNKHIASSDLAGVALTSVQELYRQNQKLRAENEAFTREMEKTRRSLKQQQAELNEVKSQIEAFSEK